MAVCKLVRYRERERVECLADLLITDTGSGEVYGFHLVGVDAAVRAIVASVYGHYELRVECPDLSVYRYWKPRGAWAVRTGRTPAGYAEAWVLPDAARQTETPRQEGAPKRRLLLAWDGDLAARLYHLLDGEEDLPLLPAWSGWLFQRFVAGGRLQELSVWRPPGITHPAAQLSAALVSWTQESVAELVQEGLARRRIQLPMAARGPAQHIEGIHDLGGYVERYGRPLLERMLRDLNPLHRPGETPPDPRLAELLRPPRGAQGDAIQAVAACLRQHRAAFLVGETGSGKTLMGLGAIHLHARGRPYRAYVQVPGHLLYKTCREIAATIPQARIYIIGRAGDGEADARQQELPAGVTYLTAPQLLKEVRTGVRPRRPAVPEFYVVSRDRAKLGWFERPGAIWNARRDTWRCPDCGSVLTQSASGRQGEQQLEEIPLGRADMNQHNKRNHRCNGCGALIWQADHSRVRRAAPALVLQKLGRWFEYAILDEMHELKGKETAQGWTVSAAAGFSRKLVLQTGTLVGGYASHMWALLWRSVPYLLIREGFRWQDARAFVEQYGVLERVVRTSGDYQYNRSSRGSDARVTVRERPGISPLLYTHLLLGISVFVQLSDVAAALPPYTERVELVTPDPELAAAYRKVESKFRDLMDDSEGVRKFAGAYVNVAMAYPDRPWEQPPVTDPATREPVLWLPELPSDGLQLKEQQLLAIVQRERALGNRVLVYVQFTGIRDVSARVRQVLAGAGYRVEVLTASVPPEKREGWVRSAVRRGVQVLITHPKLVETGLDLLEFPALVFYQTGYNLFTLRQASRRSWRIGQEQPVRVYFLAYAGTIQETALALMGRKLEAALSLEGKWSEEGLAALAASESLTAMLVRALREGLQDVDSADAVWQRMYADREHVASPVPAEPPRFEPGDAVQVVTLADLAYGRDGNRKRRQTADKQLAFLL